MLGLLYLSVLLFNLGALNLCSFQVLSLPGVLLAQEGAETDQVVLDQDILLSQLFLSDSAPFLLLLELFLLVFERLLHLVHQTTLFKQSGSGTDTVELQRRWQLDFLVINHAYCGYKYLLFKLSI